MRVPYWILRLLFTGTLKEKPCAHLALVQHTDPGAHVCADCVALGDTWPALRMCVVCGYIGCCDKSKNKHARKHYLETQHPLMRSIEPGEEWIWCYVDNALLALPRAK